MAVVAEYLIGIIIIFLFAIFAFRRNALTESGTLCAIIAGLLVFTFPIKPIPGRIWFALLAVFFITSFYATKYGARLKEEVNREFVKGSTRDFMQVFANGAGALLLAVIYHFYPLDSVFLSFAVVLAAVNADTWATELGVLSRAKPFLITTFKRVDKGISGAVSFFGTLAAFLGALVIALAAVFLFYLDSVYFNSSIALVNNVVPFVVFVAIFGTLGSFIDSILGATVQIMYFCNKCKRQTELVVHTCGTKAVYYHGFRFFDNDVVNLLSSLIAGLLGFVTYVWLFGV